MSNKINKLFFLASCLCCVLSNAAYSVNKTTHILYDKADVGYRTYGSNFKDYTLTICLQKAFGSHDPILDEDAKATTGSFLELWMDYNFEQPNEIQGKLEILIQKYLNQPYGSQMHPKSKLYIFKCMDLYHSDDLDKLTKELVVHPNRTYKQDHPKYPHEW